MTAAQRAGWIVESPSRIIGPRTGVDRPGPRPRDGATRADRRSPAGRGDLADGGRAAAMAEKGHYSASEQLALPVRGRPRPLQASRLRYPNRPGEVDVLAVAAAS